MRTALPLVVLIVLAGCDPAASKPAAKPKPPPSTTKPRPPASLPIPAKPSPPTPTWRVVSVHDGDTLRAIDAGKVEHTERLLEINADGEGQAFGSVSRWNPSLWSQIVRFSYHGITPKKPPAVTGRPGGLLVL